jgi:hypothetical protein
LGPETLFENKPSPRPPFPANEEDPLEALKRRLLESHLDGVRSAETNDRLRRAAEEAVALAWVTPYPLLVFPVLFQERAEAARAQARRQAQVRRRSHALLGAHIKVETPDGRRSLVCEEA